MSQITFSLVNQCTISGFTYVELDLLVSKTATTK